MPKRPSRARGYLTILAIFAVGGAVLWGLFQAPRSRPPVAPAVPWGAPGTGRSVRVMAANVYQAFRGLDDAVATIRSADPDYLVLVEVEPGNVSTIARAVGMGATFHPELAQRSVDLAAANRWPGVCVLSKRPLFEGRPLRVGKRRTFGAWAVAAADGGKFVVSAAYVSREHAGEQWAQLADDWHAVGRPPLLAAICVGPGGAAAATDRMRPLATVAGPVTIFGSTDWALAGAPAVPRPGVVWVDVVRAGDGGTTGPTATAPLRSR